MAQNMLGICMNKKVLIIDDDKDIAEVLALILEMEGYNPLAYYTGRDVLQKIKKYRPQLIFLDVRLDGIDGREICAQIKADDELKDIPVIMISASVTEANDADLFIAKPFNIDEIVASVNRYLKAA